MNAKHLLLTYPQCPCPKESCLDQLRAKDYGPNKVPTYIVVSEEQHQDGSPHLHAYIILSSRCDITDARRLDITHNGINYHGNYQQSISPRGSHAYVEKYGTIVEWGRRPASIAGKPNRDAVAAQVICADSAQEAHQIIKDQAPGWYFTSYNSINGAITRSRSKLAEMQKAMADLEEELSNEFARFDGEEAYVFCPVKKQMVVFGDQREE